MKKLFWVLINIFLTLATSGVWLALLLIFLIIRRSSEAKSAKELSPANSQPISSEVLYPIGEPPLNAATNKFLKSNWKIITALGSAVLLLVLSVSFVSSFLDNRQSNQIFIEVQELIENDNFSKANSRINDAVRANPSAVDKAKELRNQIKSIEDSLKLFAEAEKALLAGDLLLAAETLRKVNSNERGLRDKAEKQLSVLEEKVQALISERILGLKKSAKYQEALDAILAFYRAYPNNSSLTEQAAEISDLRERQKESQKQYAISRLKKTYDEFQDIYWYQSMSSPRYRNSNAFYIYFGVQNGSKTPLRLVMQYYSSDWLFIKEAKISIDGTVYTISNTQWERDNDSDIWEWSDEPLNDRSLIEKIIKSKSAFIRYEGNQYYDNRTISSSQKLALKQILDAYDAF